MTAEELKDLRELSKRLNRVNQEIERLRAFVEKTSPNLDGMPHGGQQNDAMADYVAKADQWLDLRIELAGKIMEEIISLSGEITELPKPTADVLWKYYAEGKSIRQIANEIHYSRRQTYNLWNDGKRRLMKGANK
jgi:DNA-directed RNA polymerase specialized sigma24 family protein